jgi:glutamine amidotransferase
LVKQPVRWSLQHTQFLEHYPGLLSSMYVAHVRQRTVGAAAPTHADTHPFVRELNGREYAFAHNGTLAGDFWQRPLGRFKPLGKTDSEFLFCLLLAEQESFEHLSEELADGVENDSIQHARPTAEQHWKWLHRFLHRLNDYGKLNCILTDGSWMLVYHDRNAWKGLTYRNVFLHEDAMRHFGDATVAVNLQASPVNQGIIVATNPLSVADGWERMVPGSMMVLHEGKIVFSAQAALHQLNGAANGATVRSGDKPKVEASESADRIKP